MSRLTVSNQANIRRQLASLRLFATRDQHRALALVECPGNVDLTSFSAANKLPFVAAEDTKDRADRITQLLGREFDILVHETSDVIDVGLLAALSGTIKSGGVLVLGIPFLLTNSSNTIGKNYFNRRFARLLREMHQQYPNKVQRLTNPTTTDQPKPSNTLATILSTTPPLRESLDENHRESLFRNNVPANTALANSLSAHDEQEALLQQACQHLSQFKRSCITIVGRRGRGKSALLGRIADSLYVQQIACAITATRPSALDTLHKHTQHPIRFLAPEQAQRPGSTVLLVDEASSLPINTLTGFLQHYDHVIYCTTVEGYEQAGRAFAIRFEEALSQWRTNPLTLRPTLPWRWAVGDPLECLIDTLLMSHLDAPPQDQSPKPLQTISVNSLVASTQRPRVEGPTDEPLRIRSLDQSTLSSNEGLLRQVYGLLRDTHYQTSSADLSHLLDGPNLQVWVLEQQNTVVAALLLASEGSIQPALHEAVLSKQRRLPHQLLPQLLAQCANQAQGLQERYTRIIRIAVCKTSRRRGLGSHLLQHVENSLLKPMGPIAAIGASFTTDAISLAFWQTNGYRQFHTGFRNNPRTGKPAAAVIKTSHSQPKLAALVDSAVSIHEDNQRTRQGDLSQQSLPAQDAALLKRFALNQRSAHDTHAALSRLANRSDLPLVFDGNGTLSRRQHERMLRQAVSELLVDSTFSQ